LEIHFIVPAVASWQLSCLLLLANGAEIATLKKQVENLKRFGSLTTF
jgi:hypothetical protein